MDFEKYKNELNYPKKPEKPKIFKRVVDSKESVEEAVNDLKKIHEDFVHYEEMMSEYTILLKKYKRVSAELYEKFKEDLFKDLGITNNPKKDLLFSKAWELGHSSGNHEVYGYAQSLVELIL